MVFSENYWYILNLLQYLSVLTQANAISLWHPGRVYFLFQKGVSCNTLEIIGRMMWIMHHLESWAVTSGAFCIWRWTQFQSGLRSSCGRGNCFGQISFGCCSTFAYRSVSHRCCNDTFILLQTCYTLETF